MLRTTLDAVLQQAEEIKKAFERDFNRDDFLAMFNERDSYLGKIESLQQSITTLSNFLL
jgi:hypothetical protein